jgi:hypothetical protein
LTVEVIRSRRQLTFQQRAKLAVDLYNALAKEGRGGDRKSYLFESKRDNQKATGGPLIQEEEQGPINILLRINRLAETRPDEFLLKKKNLELNVP